MNAAIVSIMAAVFAFYYLADPLETEWMPQCIFHKITGLQCMGCGSQRMLHALLHLNFHGAFMANALLLCSLPFLAFLVYLEISRERHPRLYARLHSVPMMITISAILLAWLIIRNIFNI